MLVKICSRLTAPNHGTVICRKNRYHGYHTDGDVCVFTCNEGFELNGETTTVCNGNGEWSLVTSTKCGKIITNALFIV